MKRKCSFLWLLILVLKKLQVTNTSIAGVTYMDNFDFEERYRDVNECNPFYWHPLHLPEECIRMFDTLIRNRLETFSPNTIFREEEKQVEMTFPYTIINTPIYVSEVRKPPPPTPIEVLFKLLRRDILDNPSAPTVEVSPYFGSIAIYKQPVSLKSVTMIKKLARAYAKAYPAPNMNTERNAKEEDIEKVKKIIIKNKN